MEGEMDRTNRDPKKLNEDTVKIDFVDVIAEPAGIQSFGLCWEFSFISFTCTKSIIYRICTAIIGVPLAIFWGLVFALFSCFHIWLVVPCVRCCLICVQFHARTYLICIRLFTIPFYEAMGKVFGSIRLTVHNEVTPQGS